MRICLLSALSCALLLAACAPEPVVPDAPDRPYEAHAIERLAVGGDPAIDLPRGESVSLGVSAWLTDLVEPVDVSAAVQWRVADPTVAGVSDEGDIEGLVEGVTSVWALYAGVPSEPVTVTVVRGRWNVNFADGGTGVQGKLLDVELVASDTTFASAGTVALTIDGLLPFGMDRTVEPWWGVVDGSPNRYRARFLVPPTATPGAHGVTVSLDGRPPESPISVQITANTSFGEVRDCAYFSGDPASNWTFQTDGNNARTWLVGDLGRNTNTRISAGSASPGDVDAWLARWSLTGALLETSDDDPALGDDVAGVQVTSMEDVFDAAFYLTATISPYATGGAVGGAMVTDCAEESMPDPMLTAVNDAALFTSGTTILAGASTPTATFSGVSLSGTVQRAWVWLDLELERPEFVTVTLRSPSGTEVELISPQWSAAYLEPGVRWQGALGGPAPFVPTSNELTNPSTGEGTAALAGQSPSGTWTVQITMNSAGTGGTWHDAALWVFTQ